jgi:hypothetical protein
VGVANTRVPVCAGPARSHPPKTHPSECVKSP